MAQPRPGIDISWTKAVTREITESRADQYKHYRARLRPLSSLLTLDHHHLTVSSSHLKHVCNFNPRNRIVQDPSPNPARRYAFRVYFGRSRGAVLMQIRVRFLGMNVASGPELAAAVTNYGGLGVIGGHGYTPKVLRQQVRPTSLPANAP